MDIQFFKEVKSHKACICSCVPLCKRCQYGYGVVSVTQGGVQRSLDVVVKTT